jgi:lipoprotein-releasing system permease protein
VKVVLTIAVRYLVARLRQSLLTVVGIAVGVLALTVMQAIMGGFRSEFVKKTLDVAPHITVRRRSVEMVDPAAPTRRALQRLHDPVVVQLARPPSPDEEEEIHSFRTIEQKIRTVPGVAASAPTVGGEVMFGFSSTWEPVTLNGILPSQQARVLDFARNLRGGAAADLERDQGGVILGQYLAERMRVAVGDRVIALAQDGTPVSLRIVALYNSMVYDVDNTGAWVNLRRAQALLGMSGAVNAIQVRCADYNAADEVARRVEYAIGMDAESWMEANANNLSLFTMFSSIMYLVTAFTMTVAGFGIAGNLIMTVSEKTFDIGVLKAMGMKSGHLSLVFLVLAMLMMGIGLTAGLSLAFLAVEGISHIPSAARPMPGVVVASETMPVFQDWTIYAVSAVFAMVVSVIAGLSPAMRAARLDPLNIIRNAAG